MGATCYTRIVYISVATMRPMFSLAAVPLGNAVQSRSSPLSFEPNFGEEATEGDHFHSRATSPQDAALSRGAAG